MVISKVHSFKSHLLSQSTKGGCYSSQQKNVRNEQNKIEVNAFMSLNHMQTNNTVLTTHISLLFSKLVVHLMHTEWWIQATSQTCSVYNLCECLLLHDLTISTCIWFWAQGSSCQVNINWAWGSLVSVSPESFVLTCLLQLLQHKASIELCSQLPGMHLLVPPARKLLWFDGSHHTIHTCPIVISDMQLKVPLSERNRKWFYWVHTYIWKIEGSPREWTQPPRCLSHMCTFNRPSSCNTPPQLQPEKTTKTIGVTCTREALTKSAPWSEKQGVS